MLLDFLARAFNVFARAVSRVTAGSGDQSDPCKQEQQYFLNHNHFLLRFIVELLEFLLSGQSLRTGNIRSMGFCPANRAPRRLPDGFVSEQPQSGNDSVAPRSIAGSFVK